MQAKESMTRKEAEYMIQQLRGWDGQDTFGLDRILGEMGLSALTDEAVRRLARIHQEDEGNISKFNKSPEEWAASRGRLFA